LSGKTVTLTLEAEARNPECRLLGRADPFGARTTDLPNIIFYVIDGAAPNS